MARFPEAWIEDLRARADIVQTISAYVPLKKNGNNYWGLCPFHGEKTASFSVSPGKQMYHCFGCKASGSVFNFVMEMEHLTYPEALRFVAEQNHVPLPQMIEDPGYQERKEKRDRLLACNREAAMYFNHLLYQPQGEKALNYLKGRGLTDAVIRKFGLGASADSWDALTIYLQGKGYTEDEIRRAGLCIIKEEERDAQGNVIKKRRVFDFFRDRAMFPIIDRYGNVLGFGGRILGPGEPKYMNTTDTEIFNKRKNVYAANLLQKEKQLDHVILTEGYMDVVALTQFGVHGACATLGTALTPEQAQLMKKFAPNIYISYDGDKAGQAAILKALGILESEGIPCRVLDFPDKLDPDEFMRRDGIEGFNNLPAITGPTYRIRRLRDDFDLSTQEGRVSYARKAAEILKPLDPVERETHMQELMVRTGFDRSVLMEQIGGSVQKTEIKAENVQSTQELRPSRRINVSSDIRRAQEIMLSLLSTGRLPEDLVSEEDFDEGVWKDIYRLLSSGKSAAAVLEMQETDEKRAQVSRILMAASGEEDASQLVKMAGDCLRSERLRKIDERLAELSRRLTTMSADEKRMAMQEFMMLNDSRRSLQQGH